MASKLTAFKNAVLARNVVARVLEATEFKSPEALEAYLKKHPKADKSKHSVKKKDEPKKKESPKDSGSIEDALRERFSPEQRREFIKKHDPDHPVLKEEAKKKEDKKETSIEDALKDKFSPAQLKEYFEKHNK